MKATYEAPNFDLLLKACQTTSKALFPNFILSKLDNVDEVKLNRYRFVYSKLHDFEDYMRSLGVDVLFKKARFML